MAEPAAQPVAPQRHSWLPAWWPRARGRGRGTAAAAASSSPQPGQPAQAPKRHLVVLVNGLYGSRSNWNVICEQLAATLPPDTLLHPSAVNERFATYSGIDVCGARLADEVRGVVGRHPKLTRVSFVGHSMGGLLARYAIGALFNPRTGTISGLQPAHFITLATPHLGCDTDGVAQVPFIGWSGSLPLLGRSLQQSLASISGATAALIFRRTGEQFFLLDAAPPSGGQPAGSAQLPLLLQMTQDCHDRGLHFMSALAAFKTRTAIANMTGDHLVGSANSSLRSMEGLPPPPPSAATAKGVVLEDPLSAAFFPDTWQQLKGANVPYAASRQWDSTVGSGSDSSSRGGGGGLQPKQQQPAAGWRGADAPAWHEVGAVSPGPSTSRSSPPQQPSPAGWASAPGRQQQQQQQQQQQRGAAALATLEPEPGGGPAPSDDSDDPIAQLERSTQSAASAAAAAAEADLASGLSGHGTPAAASAAAAAQAVAADAAALAAGSSRSEVLAHMLSRLQELPWRRVDVSFAGARFGFAHNNLQVTRRLLNFEGNAMPVWLAQQLAAMDAEIWPSGQIPRSNE